MRAMSWRPFGVRRNSTSETLSSNLALGSYAAAASAGFKPAAPGAPNAVIVFKKDLRPEEWVSMLTSWQDVRVIGIRSANIAYVRISRHRSRSHRHSGRGGEGR